MFILPSIDCLKEQLNFKIEQRLNVKTHERGHLSLHHIIDQYLQIFIHKTEPSSKLQALSSLAPKIFQLSEEKLEYYRQSKWGVVKEFFSKLINLWTFGRFESSAAIGKEFTQDIIKYLNQIEKEERFVEKGISPPSTPSPTPCNSPAIEQVLNAEQIPAPAFFPLESEVEMGVSHKNEKEEQTIMASSDGWDNQSELLKEEPFVEPKSPPVEEQGITETEEDTLLTLIEKPISKLVVEAPFIEPSIKIDPPPPVIQKTPLTPQEEFIRDLDSMWKHATYSSKKVIRFVLHACFMGNGKIISWKKTDKEGEYQIQLDKPHVSKHCNIPGGVQVKQKMKISFKEEMGPNGIYRQVVTYPDQGFAAKVSWIWWPIPLNQVFIEGDPAQVVLRTIFKDFNLSAQKIISIGSGLIWN